MMFNALSFNAMMFDTASFMHSLEGMNVEIGVYCRIMNDNNNNLNGYDSLAILDKTLDFLKRKRSTLHLGEKHPRLPRNGLINHLRVVQTHFDIVLNCTSAYAGSVSLYLQGLRETFGDFDITTNREFVPEDLPWEVDHKSAHGLGVHKYDLDIFFNKGKGLMLELANKHIVEVHGLRVQSAEFVMAINRLWRVPKHMIVGNAKPKERLCAETIDPELKAELQRCM